MMGHTKGTYLKILDLTTAIFKNLTISDYHKELLVLMVAAHKECNYEWEQHVSIAQAAGVREDRSANADVRKEAVQYYSYPDYKMDNIASTPGGPFEAGADIGLNEWITMRIEVQGQQATLYLNDKKEPVLTIKNMKGNLKSGAIGLWVDIGTQGYFKDLKITKNKKSIFFA
ncbi:MAG: hypothetical protein JWP81_5415 [Ferruginibacter sp.]|nr:hypothetical protein [Ferruginibacter sp.]